MNTIRDKILRNNFPQMNYLDINLIKQVQDLYAENNKMLIKGEKYLNKWRDRSCSWIGRLNIRCQFSPK